MFKTASSGGCTPMLRNAVPHRDGHDALTDGTCGCRNDFLDGQFMAFEVPFHQFFIFFRHGVQQLRPLFS